MGTRLLALLAENAHRFLSHYGWMGTDARLVQFEGCFYVSKPLRLDGDGGRKPGRTPVQTFLSHYGWMGTLLEDVFLGRFIWFLSNYGWMGT